ncbi:hypothetical protein A8L34_08000 [Bacillus sp. FJAT-27264]|nr:hypothetical protein A8L34_08000 [Bacillus sp. FJAT-27264]
MESEQIVIRIGSVSLLIVAAWLKQTLLIIKVQRTYRRRGQFGECANRIIRLTYLSQLLSDKSVAPDVTSGASILFYVIQKTNIKLKRPA